MRLEAAGLPHPATRVAAPAASAVPPSVCRNRRRVSGGGGVVVPSACTCPGTGGCVDPNPLIDPCSPVMMTGLPIATLPVLLTLTGWCVWGLGVWRPAAGMDFAGTRKEPETV